MHVVVTNLIRMYLRQASYVCTCIHTSHYASSSMDTASSSAMQGMGHQAVKQKEGKLTGTSADLRRMKVPQLKEALRKVGVPEDMIANGRRWELVDLLR